MGMSEPNVTGVVEFADPENHTLEPKITTLSYINLKKLKQFKTRCKDDMVNSDN